MKSKCKTWSIELDYRLKRVGKTNTRPGKEITRILNDLGVKRTADNIYSGEVTDLPKAARELGRVLAHLAELDVYPEQTLGSVIRIQAK